MVLNQLQCLQDGGNTGVGDCYLDIKAIKKAILVPNDFVIEAADLATAQDVYDYLDDLTLGNVSERVYPIGDFVGITNNSTEPAAETFGYGGIAITNDGKYDWTLRFTKGGVCLNKALRKFNRRNLSVLFIDANGVLFGVKVGQTLKGIPLELNYTLPFIINDGTASTQYQIRFLFDPKYINDQVGFVSPEDAGLFGQLEGLQDVALTLQGGVSPVFNIQAVTGCDQTNLVSLFGATLAVPGAWSAKNTTTGVAIDITSVAVSGNYYALTLDNDPALPASITFSMASPAALAVLGVDGFESNTVIKTT